MSPDHILTRLRAADPVTWLRDETDAYAPPPRHVMERIVASTPPPPPRGRWRRRLVIAAATASVAAAAALGLLQLLPSDKRVDLAAKAYAATAPGDSVVYTKLTLESSTTPGFHPGPGPDGDRTTEEIWQYRGRAHRVTDVIRVGGNDAGRTWRYEYDTRGDVLRALYPNGTVDTLRRTDNSQIRRIFESETQTVVDLFRKRYADAQLRDAGKTIFAGRPARAYEVIKAPTPKRTPVPVPDRETFYLDPENGLPLGSASVTYGWSVGRLNPKDLRPPRRPAVKPDVEHRSTVIVDRYERLPATPENLAKLDAPAIDAAASEPLSRPRRKGNPKG
jgi:hypothetical protein